MKENEDLYINVDELHTLLDNIKEMNPKWNECVSEIINLTYDLKWIEIKKYEMCH